MSKFILSTDSCCDVFKSHLSARHIEVLPMSYCIEEPVFSLYDNDAEYQQFFAKMRTGATPTTSQPNMTECTEYFERLTQMYPHTDILHLTISSGLSGTYNNCVTAAAEVKESKKLSQDILISDALTTTQGQAYLLEIAEGCRDKGMTARETSAHIADATLRLNHFIVANDLYHLHRGGRLSKIAAIAGTILQIKPIIVFDKGGHLVTFDKTKGMAKTLRYLVECISKYGGDTVNYPVYIAHTDAADVAETLREMIAEEYPAVSIKTGWVGPIVGSHLGPGAFAIVFMGDTRMK